MDEVEALTHEELLVLVGLLRLILLADHRVEGEEIDAVDAVATRIAEKQGGTSSGDAPYREAPLPPVGPEGLQALFAEADVSLPDGKAIRAAAARIERQEARDTIFAMVADVAFVDWVHPFEQAVLDELATLWDLRIETVDG